MIDASFYEQEQRSYGETDHFARGRLNNCDRLGLLTGTIRCAQYWSYDSASGATVIKSIPPTYCIWPPDQRTVFSNPPLNPNAALKPRGEWRFDLAFVGHYPFDSAAVDLPFLGIMLAWFDAHITANLLGSPLLEGSYPFVPKSQWLVEGAPSQMIPAQPGFTEGGPYPPPTNFVYNPTIAIVAGAMPGTVNRTFYFRTAPPNFCHPAFGLPQFENVAGPIGPPPDGETHYYPTAFLDAPVLTAGMPDVLIWEATFTLRRIFDFSPRIVATQTRYGTAAVEAGIYRVTYQENSFNDGNGKVQWIWNLGAGAGNQNLGGITPPQDYATAGPRTVTVAVTDGAGQVYTTTRPVTLKRVDFTSAIVSGGLRQFTNLATAGDSTITSSTWRFYDRDHFPFPNASSTLTNPTFDYTGLPSPYYADLRIFWADGTSYVTPTIVVP